MTACLYCTEAPNDRDLFRALGTMALSAPIRFGDINFFGYPDSEGVPIRVCIERKHLQDMVNCILQGRYLHQAQNAHEAGFSHLVLILEVRDLRPSPQTGLVETLSYRKPVISGGITLSRLLHNKRPRRSWQPVEPPISYSRFSQYLLEIQRDLGILYHRTSSVEETAAAVRAIWLNFQKLPENHNSLHQFYSAPHRLELLRKPSLVRRVGKELDGIGWERAKAVEARFRSVSEMCAAGVREWEEVEGIGKKTAEKAVAQLGGRQ